MPKTYLKITAILCLLFVACTTQQSGDKKVSNMGEVKQEMANVNKLLLEKDNQRINAYIKRRGWEMIATETGLRYMISHHGDGLKAEKGKNIVLKYRIELLDGTLCYTSEEEGNKEFTIGKGGVEAGLEELVLKLHVNDRATAIMLPHLAHGLVGDENRIPARSVIVYYIEVIKIY